MHTKEIDIYLKRVENFRQRIEKFFFPKRLPVKLRFAPIEAEEPLSFSQIRELTMIPIVPGQQWGDAWQRAGFHVLVQIPAEWQNKEVALKIDLGGEGLVFSEKGEILQSISSYSVLFDAQLRDTIFINPAQNQEIEFWLECTASGIFGINRSKDPYENKTALHGTYQASVRYAFISTFNRALWALALDLDILLDLLKNLPKNSVRFVRILKAINQAIQTFADDVDRAQEARSVLQKVLQQPACASELMVYAVGHGHIDTAWLWPVSETIRKCARTFSNQIQLIEKYPQYVFGASQAQHYQFVKTYYPELYRKIKKFVVQKRWEIQGAMWVEADCNLPSGESLTRQILYGKNFFRDEFGVEVGNLWLPDAFGFPPTLPQILKLSGIKYFLTQKLSWNQVNDFPFTLFRWQGIDGSQVLAHFPPENNYDSSLRPDSLIRGRDNFKEKEIADEFLSLFGLGDGGGGPKEEHIEYGLRQQNLEGAPKVRFATAHSFFERVANYFDELPVWTGDLYLEGHRGTFTSQARVKNENRRLEFKIRLTEMMVSCLAADQYPRAELEQAWKTILLNQFHDIIPGSSINEVYQKTLEDYKNVHAILDQILAQVANTFFKRQKNSLVLFNSLPFPVEEVIDLPEGWAAAVDSENNPLPVQQAQSKHWVKVTLPALGVLNLFKSEKSVAAQVKEKTDDRLILENARIRYVFNSKGRLIEAYDKEAQQSVMVPGEGNVLQLFEDRPNNWDAWDIDPFYEEHLLETAEAITARKVVSGNLKETLFFEFETGNSKIEQYVSLRAHSKRLDFATHVHWQESHRLLRVSFKTELQASQAAFDVQYGYYLRPTHRNSSFERARFEVVGHKYADLSRPDYGVALMSDSKYGYKVLENELSLSLLRSPTYPDPVCDRGEHDFVYSLLPHTGDLIHSDVMQEALLLNQPPVCFEGFESEQAQLLPFSLSGQFVHLEAVKRAEKEDHLIVRLVEARGIKSHTYLNFFQKPNRVIETDLLEWRELKELKAESLMRIEFEPFEIKTLKIIF